MHTAPSLSSNDVTHLHAFCLFTGYPQSGHSLVGALLDAHPDAVIAHAADVLDLVRTDITREELFATLIENSRAAAETGRMQTGYSYAVEGSWQGRARSLRVIGDKAGAKTTRGLIKEPDALEAVERLVGLPLRLIHVIRNPFDNVASIRLIKEQKTMPRSAASFGRLANENARVLALGRPVLTVRHEDLVADPKRELRRLCEFLDLPPEDDYLETAASLVFSSPRRTREKVEWAPETIAAVEDVIAAHDFFAGYTYEN